MHVKNSTTFVLNRVNHTSVKGTAPLRRHPFCLALWGRLLAPSCYADLHFSLLLRTSEITACYADLKPGAGAIEHLLSNAASEWAQPCEFAAAAGAVAGVLHELHVLTY